MTTPRKRRSKAEIEAARRRAATARKARLKKVHRMTVQQYEDLKAYQGGTCPLCLRANGKTKALAVEHDHEIAEDCDHPVNESCIDCWRGLCCSVCNKIIGHARDDPEFFYRAIHYLTDPPAQRFFNGRLSQRGTSRRKDHYPPATAPLPASGSGASRLPDNSGCDAGSF